MTTPERIESLKAKFDAARNKCVQAQAGRRPVPLEDVVANDTWLDWEVASEEYADAAIELALAVTYHTSTP